MTFNVLSDGDDILATPLMQNYRHCNFGSDLLPVDNVGGGVNNTLSLGSSSYRWASGYFYDLDIADDATIAGGCSITGDLSASGATFSTVDNGAGAYKKKEIVISSWNMHGTSGGSFTKIIAHGLTVADIRSISNVYIKHDDNDNRYEFFANAGASGNIVVDATNITLTITAGCTFDASTFNSSSIKGYIIIEYV